jgi:4a-hydroxytetrahydrobiopterin dehydratase
MYPHPARIRRRGADAMTDQEIDTLVRMSCIACRRGEPTVTDAEIARFHPQIPDWEVVEAAGVRCLRRVFTFDDFGRSLAFTNRVGALAEREAHHPALLTEWGSTTVTWWTHKIKGLHRNDFIMAAKTDELYRP